MEIGPISVGRPSRPAGKGGKHQWDGYLSKEAAKPFCLQKISHLDDPKTSSPKFMREVAKRT